MTAAPYQLLTAGSRAACWRWGWLVLRRAALAEQRFPPPDFESGYKLPVTLTPPAAALCSRNTSTWRCLAALGLGCLLRLKQRSRKAVLGLSLFSLLYFGFWRKGCICAIGSLQNVALGLVRPGYAVPLTALVFFARAAGRRAVCRARLLRGGLPARRVAGPGAAQAGESAAWLEHALGLMPYIYLGAGVVRRDRQRFHHLPVRSVRADLPVERAASGCCSWAARCCWSGCSWAGHTAVFSVPMARCSSWRRSSRNGA